MSAPASPLAGLPTATVSDALDKLGLPGALDGIGATTCPGSRVNGPAFTVTYAPVGAEHGTVGDFLDDVPAGAVVVIDNRGRLDCTVWGGIMTRLARHRGVAATVVDGVCRDTAEAQEVAYPIWARGRFMRTGKDRVRLVATQSPVVVAGVEVRPGDEVCADADGVVVVPAARVAEVADLAAGIERVEEQIVDRVLGGATLREARAALGYHRLQTAHAPSTGDDA